MTVRGLAVIEQNCNTDRQNKPVYPDETMFFRLFGDGVLYLIKDKAHSVFNINKNKSGG